MRVLLLSLLLLAFIARVAGQIIAVLYAPSWLPPMTDWYSGLLPYPILLPVQLAIVVLMLWMLRHQPSPRAARNITIFATLYAVSMLVRFILLRTQHPELQWYEGGMIPILFHWVLATFLLTYAKSEERGTMKDER